VAAVLVLLGPECRSIFGHKVDDHMPEIIFVVFSAENPAWSMLRVPIFAKLFEGTASLKLEAKSIKCIGKIVTLIYIIRLAFSSVFVCLKLKALC
jgi:hypothetical protein